MLAMAEAKQVGLWRTLARRYRDERARIGWLYATIELLDDLWNYVRDSTPARRRERYGDIEYDWDQRVNTTAATVSDRARLEAALSGAPYQPIPPEEFRESMGRVPVRHEECTFIDLGSGKGRALLLASEYPFRRIIGVELVRELHEVARENVAKYKSEAQRCTDIELICADARDFKFPLEPTLLYLFNPFIDAVFEAVLDRLERSLREHPREAYVVYHNPVRKRIFDRRRWLEPVETSEQFTIYRARPSR